MNGWLIYDAEGRKRNGWFIDRLIESAGQLGSRLTLIEAEKLRFGIIGGKPGVLLNGRNAFLPDYAIVRTICPLLSKTLESAGVKVFNSAEVSKICNDKRLTHALLAGASVPTADTFFTNKTLFDPESYDYPLILKSPDGHGGREVFLAHSAEEAQRAAETIASKELLLQSVQTPGLDVRVYLLDGKILAAVRRTSESDFRSNYSLGGKAVIVKPTAEMLSAVNNLYGLLHPTFAGVDFIFDQSGKPLLNEVEDVVGTRMLYALTDLPVHELFISAVLGKL